MASLSLESRFKYKRQLKEAEQRENSEESSKNREKCKNNGAKVQWDWLPIRLRVHENVREGLVPRVSKG
jgi:hypothetical protein